MCSIPSRFLGIALLLAGLLSIALYPSKAGQSPTAPIPTYIFGRADFPVGNQPVAVASGDFNGDGQPDLVVVNQNDNTISILLGKPDGTFTPHVDYPTGPVPTAVLVDDFNRDGNPDIAVVNQNCKLQGNVHSPPTFVCGNGTVGIFLGNGDGTFAPETEYLAGGVQPVAIASGDFNGDGNLDLAVAIASFCYGEGSGGACRTGTLSVFLGDGTGSFQMPVTYPTPSGVFSVVVADFNGDHKPDIGVAGGGPPNTSLPGTVSVFLGNGDGTFQPQVASTLGASNGLALAAADFNGDGKIDLASAGNGFVDIMTGNGDGTFIFKQHYAGGNTVAAADFNGDGKADLAFLVTTNAFANYSAAVMLGDGDGTFQPAVQYSTGVNPQSLLAVDVNGDGKLDLVASCAQFSIIGLPGAVSVDLGFGDGTFGGSTPVGPGSPVGNGALAITSADLNGDGKQDIVTAGSIFLGNGDGTFQTSVNPGNFVPDATADFVAAADFNGDGKTDLAVVNTLCTPGTICNPGSVSIFLGTGDFSNATPGPYQPRVDYAVGVMPNMLTIGDFNGDSKIDLAVANGSGFSSGSISVLPGKGDGTFQQQIQTGVQGTNWIANGDFNGDGKLDVAVVTSGNVAIMLGNGDGTFHQGSSYTLYTADGVGTITAGDFNHDGKLDLAVTHLQQASNQGMVAVFLGVGDGTFQAPVDYLSSSVASAVVQSTDINGDGNLDLLICAYGAPYPFTVLAGNGDGTFRSPVAYLVPAGGAIPFTINDFNQDGVPDVASIGSDGNVGVLLSTPFISVSPAALNFGGQGVGTTSPAQKITVSNATNVPFSITGAVASGTFTATNNCGTLQPGANCTVSVKLSPSAVSAQTGTLTITDSTRTSPEIVPLTGTGVSGPFLTAFPSRYTFRPQLVGTTSSSPVAVQLVNTGNASLTFNSVGIAGTNGPDFGQTNNCGGTLAVGASCTVNVTFTPAAGGLRSANISVSDSVSTPLLVPIFGSGSDFQISATAFSPASIAAGSSSSSTVSISSLGGFSGTVTLSCASGLSAGVSCSFNPATVTASSAGVVSSTLTVNTTASASPAAYTIGIAGASGSLSHNASQALTVQSSQPPAFSLAPSSSGSSSASVTAGQSAKFTLSATSTNGFSGTVNLTCAVSPAPTNAPKCTVPATVQVAAGTPGSFSVTVATTAPTSAQLWTPSGFQNMWAALMFSGLFVMAFALVRVGNGTNNKRRNYALVSLLLFAFALVGCGGGGSTGDGGGGGGAAGTPAGSYTVTVTGTSGSVKQTSTLTLTVN